MADEIWNRIVHDGARRWDLEIPDRPPFEDIPDRYHLPVVETHERTYKTYPTTFEIIRSGDRWSYAWHIQLPSWGTSFGPFPHFCTPYRSREGAIEAAAQRLESERGDHVEGSKAADLRSLVRWIRDLATPEQTTLDF